MKNTVLDLLEEHQTVVTTLKESAALLHEMAEKLTYTLSAGGTIYLCGNGGSAADCQHIAAEFMGRFQKERGPLAAEALTTNTSILTAIGNDYDFREVFARQVEARVGPLDVVVGISTSGESPNVLRAMWAARRMQALTLGFTGAEGWSLIRATDLCLRVLSANTARVQEAHILAWHIICDLVEQGLE